MKNLFKYIIAATIVVMISANVNAQTKKLGHINSSDLLLAMPEKDTAQKIMDRYKKDLESEYQKLSTELETKYQDFQANQATMTDLIKQMKQQELQDLNTRIEDFKAKAQEDLQKKQDELLNPIIEKAKKAIEDVAKENKYSYIFDTGVGVVLFAEPTDDIMPLVKKKLGLQ